MKSTLVKVLVVVMALAMVLPMVVACKKDNGNTTTTAPAGTNTNPAAAVKPWEDGKTYTYRMGPSDLPTMWNVQDYQSNSSTYVLDYTSDSLYAFEYNKDFTGYEIIPAMASAFPTDETDKYVGKFGIVAGDKNKVWKIPLKSNLKFDNGDPITAGTFVESMKLLLNPQAAHYRADNMWASGDLKIYGAEDYAKHGVYSLYEIVSENYGEDEYINPDNFVADANGILQYEGKDLVLALDNGGRWSDYSLEYYNTRSAFAANQESYDRLSKAADVSKRVKLTADLLKDLQNCIACLHGCATVEEYAAATTDTMDGANYAYVEFEEMAFWGMIAPDYSYDPTNETDGVGFFADGNNLVVVLKNAMEDNFYLRYELSTSFFLVHPELYKSLEKITDGVYSNTYGTSVDTFIGFGPYKLTNYVEGSTILLERNLNWRGYQDGEYTEGTYMTDAVSYQKVTENATRLMMFLKGEIDSYGLNAEDMADYQGSKYTYYNDSESTWYLVMNPDLTVLESNQKTTDPVNAGNDVIKTVLSITEFRQALSYSLDRAKFNLTLQPTAGIAKALLSSMIVADPESGKTYRSLDEAKDAILKFWGLADEWGEGKTYADRDEAIASITGYDLAGAKTLFGKAYDQAVADGLITADQVASGKWEVQILIGKPSDGNFYNNGYEFLKSCWTEAVAGTPFEGHLTFKQSQTLGSTAFGEYLRTGQVDLLFGVGYGGSMFNPYSMMDCFTGNLQYDPFTDKTKIDLDITFTNADDKELNGKTLRASLYDWVSQICQGNKVSVKVIGADGQPTGETMEISAGSSDLSSRRITILAATEAKILTLANVFPLMTDSSASLKCMRVNYKTEDYVVGMGRGGIEWYTYAMDDAEFAAYVAKQDGGVLNYK